MAINLHIDLGNAFRIFATPGRTAGAMCLRCQGDDRGTFIPTDSVTAVLRWIDHHERHRHEGEHLTPEARTARS